MKTGVILARFQPIHVGHIELIKKAINENDKVLIFIGSADKLDARNPIPCNIRHKLVEQALIEEAITYPEDFEKVKLVDLPDLTTEYDNSHDWGFYLYSHVVKEMGTGQFTIYYSDGYEIITSWFPGWLLRDQVSLNLLARNSCQNGISATQVRKAIRDDHTEETELTGMVPKSVMDNISSIRAFLNVWDSKIWGE